LWFEKVILALSSLYISFTIFSISGINILASNWKLGGIFNIELNLTLLNSSYEIPSIIHPEFIKIVGICLSLGVMNIIYLQKKNPFKK
jgi:hypothetical protein